MKDILLDAFKNSNNSLEKVKVGELFWWPFRISNLFIIVDHPLTISQNVTDIVTILA